MAIMRSPQQTAGEKIGLGVPVESKNENPRLDDNHTTLGRVLVVAVTFNGGATITRTLRSLAGQTYPQLDLLVIDNGSSDGTPDLIRRMDLVRPVEILELGENLGVAAALNRGVTLAAERGYDWASFSIRTPTPPRTWSRLLRRPSQAFTMNGSAPSFPRPGTPSDPP